MINLEEATSQFRQCREALSILNNQEEEPTIAERNQAETAYYAARQAVTDQLLSLLSEDNRQAMQHGLQEYSRLAGLLHARALVRYEALERRMDKVMDGSFATAESVSDPYGQIRAEQNGLDEYCNNLIEKAIETLQEDDSPRTTP